MEPTRLWNRWFVMLLLIEGLLQMGEYIMRPLVSNYSIVLGASVSLAGFLAGLLATTALIVRPMSGAISDKLSKKTLLIASSGTFAIGAFGCAFAPSVVVMGFFLVIQGIAFAFKSAIVISLVPLVVPAKYTGSGVGWMGLAYTIALAVGPGVGSQLGVTFGYSTSFTLAGIALAAAFVLSLFFRVPRGAESRRKREDAETHKDNCADCEKLKRKKFSLSSFCYIPAIPFSVIAGFVITSQGITSCFLLLTCEMQNIGVNAVSVYFGIYAIANLCARPIAGRACDAWGVRVVAPPLMIIAILGMLSVAFVPSVAGVAVGGLCMGLGQGPAYAVIQAESVRGVSSDQLGRAANTFFILPDLGMGLGPALGGAILQAGGSVAMYVFNALVILIALVIFLALKPLQHYFRDWINHETRLEN